eukprot:322054-Rhodomonas_salina.1
MPSCQRLLESSPNSAQRTSHQLRSPACRAQLSHLDLAERVLGALPVQGRRPIRVEVGHLNRARLVLCGHHAVLSLTSRGLRKAFAHAMDGLPGAWSVLRCEGSTVMSAMRNGALPGGCGRRTGCRPC